MKSKLGVLFAQDSNLIYQCKRKSFSFFVAFFTASSSSSHQNSLQLNLLRDTVLGMCLQPFFMFIYYGSDIFKLRVSKITWPFFFFFRNMISKAFILPRLARRSPSSPLRVYWTLERPHDPVKGTGHIGAHPFKLTKTDLSVALLH